MGAGRWTVSSHPSGIVFREASAEALLFGEMVRVMDRGQVRDSLLGVFTALCLHNLNPESRRNRIEKVYQAIAMILSKPACTASGVQGAFNDQKPMGDRKKRFELAEKARSIVRRIRDNGAEFFRTATFDTEDLRCFRDGVVTGRQGLRARSGDPDEAFELIGLRFVHIDQDMNGGNHDFGVTEADDVQHRLRSA